MRSRSHRLQDNVAEVADGDYSSWQPGTETCMSDGHATLLCDILLEFLVRAKAASGSSGKAEL